MSKFALIQDISRMLSTAPPPVAAAWRAGWYGIERCPKKFTVMDSCGCCFTEYAPGWYGYPPGKLSRHRIKYSLERTMICSLDGSTKVRAVIGGGTCCCTHN